MTSETPSGVLVVDKPEGPTSHDVVDVVRKAFHLRRVGHAGTLDPLATGVLPVLLGKATRLAWLLLGGDKEYRATVRLGYATTSDDRTGEPLSPPCRVDAGRAEVLRAIEELRGISEQVPPTFSAKWVKGERAYALARAGRPVRREPVPVTVHSMVLIDFRGEEVDLLVRCSAGTYVRALARDLGERLGVGAHLSALRRTISGDFGLEEAVPLEVVGHPETAKKIVPLRALLTALPAVRVGSEGRAALTHGRDLSRELVLEGFPEGPPERVRVLDTSGELLGLAVPRGFGVGVPSLPLEPVFHPEVVLQGG